MKIEINGHVCVHVAGWDAGEEGEWGLRWRGKGTSTWWWYRTWEGVGRWRVCGSGVPGQQRGSQCTETGGPTGRPTWTFAIRTSPSSSFCQTPTLFSSPMLFLPLGSSARPSLLTPSSSNFLTLPQTKVTAIWATRSGVHFPLLTSVNYYFQKKQPTFSWQLRFYTYNLYLFYILFSLWFNKWGTMLSPLLLIYL